MKGVAPTGTPPNFVSKPNARQAQGKVYLECTVSSDPPPTVSWMLNNKPIALGGRLNASTVKQGNVYLISLEMKDLTLQDKGEYKCIVKNPKGEAAATLMLNLDGKKKRSVF